MNICQKCAADNPPDKPFCGDCGAALAGNDPATPSSASPQSTSGIQITAGPTGASITDKGERKTITALFADIKGSTELMESLDPEEARAIVNELISEADNA